MNETPAPTNAQFDDSDRLLRTYVDLCLGVKTGLETCLEFANRVMGAREIAARRPQAEASIKNFERVAVRAEAEFATTYEEFSQTCDRARETAASITSTIETSAGIERLMAMYEMETLDEIAITKSILRSKFGPTVPQFLQGLEETNQRISGEADSSGIVYVPDASD